MAVSTAYAPLTFAGNGSTTAFAVSWPFFSGTLLVTEVASTGIETVKTITTHYTVSGGTDADGLPATGTVTMLTAPASGTTLRIERRTSKTQSSTWTNGGSFQAKTLEAALDKNLLIAQETSADGADDVTGDVLQLNTAGATDYWDGEDHIIRNILDGTEDDDAVTKSQLDAAMVGTTYFTQAGTGAVTRTWQSKMRESVSVLDYIPTAYHANILAGTSTDDVTTYVQAAIDYLLTLGGGTLYFPNGTYYLPSSTSLDPDIGNIAFVGASKEATILKINEGTSGSKRYTFKNTDNVAKGSLVFRNLQFQGTLATTAQRAGNPLWLDYYSSVVLDGCRWYNVGGEAMDFHYCDFFQCTDSAFENIAADCVRCRDCSSSLITGNEFLRSGDDPIAVHTSNAPPTPMSERHIITNNRIINAGGSLKVLGAKKATITGNILHLCNDVGIYVSATIGVGEGNNAQNDIIVEDNTVTDIRKVTSGTAATPASYIALQVLAARGAAATNSTTPDSYDSTGGTIIKPWDWYHGEDADATHAIPPGSGFRVGNNTCRRTLPDAAAFSDYGYGTALYQGVGYDPAISGTNLRPTAGLNFGSNPDFTNTMVTGNTIQHTGSGIAFPAPDSNYCYRSVAINGNSISDALNRCINLGSAAYRSDMVIESNILDGDFYRVNSNSNLDGSYDANTIPNGIDSGNITGLIIRRNVFKNVCRMVATNVISSLLIEDNIAYCGSPAAVGFNIGNKGIGEILTGYGSWRYAIIDADPTSGTYGALSSEMVRQSTAMPSSGWYYRGWITWDSTPSASNGRLGWLRATSGTGHVLDTDWIELGAVRGPSSATDNALVRFDATTGRLLQNSGVIVDDSNNVSGMATLTMPNTGLHLLDTNASHDMIVAPGSDLTADRTLTVTTGDADRTLDISAGSVTISAAGAALIDDASASAQRTTLGVGTGDSPEFTAVNVGHATDTTITRTGAGDIAVEGNAIYRAGGTDVPVADGGTGASTARGASANLAGWYVIGASAVAVSVSATTSEETIATIPIPAGAMGANGILRITTLWTVTNSANNKTCRVRLGGLAGTSFMAMTVTTVVSLQYYTLIRNRNSASSNIGFYQAAGTPFQSSGSASTTGAVDTSSGQDLVITGQKASSGETLTLEAYQVEVFYQA